MIKGVRGVLKPLAYLSPSLVLNLKDKMYKNEKLSVSLMKTVKLNIIQETKKTIGF